MFLIKKECFIYYYYYFYYIELPIQNYQNNTIRVWFLIYKFISKGENPHEKSLRSIIVDLICFSSLNTKTMEMYASSAFYKLFGHQIPYLWKVLYMCVFTFYISLFT